ncbi:fimbrial protein [Cupriavidus metallidurans]|uniref:fimbrial protein n=1 Tax=Cupriavidus TaxID=106589 RepID=UPI0002A22FEE|nr:MULTISPECIES: fimbrial protein [Cupriavidus]ELA01380.1 Type-1 fimbrial protein subunit precursor [Cupriavidus sp. HMR-1]GMG89026.1 ferrous iron transporter B [Cupriavidus sp. TKC]HBD38908.1 fimbrial protein [Cupriavidus sp.]HBO79371.1 fimbrial protein [Cupriavidus sp.]
MKHIRTKILATSLLLATMSPAAFAVDGTITFTGRVTGQTCTISGNGRPAGDFTIVLPTVTASTLNTAGNIAGRTPFNIRLTNCNPNTGNVAVHFEPGAAVDLGTGRLKNTVVNSPASGSTPAITGASNVQIGLLNSDMTNINVGAAFASQNSQRVAITSGAATLQYYAQYVATGAATLGTLQTSATYSIVYP